VSKTGTPLRSGYLFAVGLSSAVIFTGVPQNLWVPQAYARGSAGDQ